MIKIIGGRCSGKTLKLIEEASKTDCIILCKYQAKIYEQYILDKGINNVKVLNYKDLNSNTD